MAAHKFLVRSGAALLEVLGIVTSAGSSDSGHLVALDAGGKLDSSVLPTGVGAETKSIVTSENLAAGAWVNVYDVSGTPTARNADASAASAGKPANGFVLAATTSPAAALVYLAGVNNQLSSLTAGAAYLSDSSAGATTQTAPSTSGHMVQYVGDAISATEVAFQPTRPVILV